MNPAPAAPPAPPASGTPGSNIVKRVGLLAALAAPLVNIWSCSSW